MRISSHCNDPAESDSQYGCISLILIACAVTSTVLALLFVGFLAWRQSVKDHRARRAARQQDIDLEERAFSANAFVRTESMGSEVSAPPSYHSMQDDVMVVSAPTEGKYEEKRGGIEGRVPGSETGKTSEG